MDLKRFSKGLIICAIEMILILKECTGCNFPGSWDGTWYSSTRGDITINSTHLASIDTVLTGDVTYTCYLNDGDTYVIASETFQLFSTDMKAYFCLEMTTLSSASIIYYHNTTENAQANEERYKLFPTSNTGVSLADVCDDTANTTAWEILVKQGSEATAAVNCPSDLEGIYGYTITSGGVTSCALNESSLDVCTDASQLSSNMTLCSTESIAYTADGEALCIYTTTETYDYALVLNMDASTDESTTYRVSCLVISSDANNTFVSQSPQVCAFGQTPTSVSGGATVILERTDQCVSTTTQTTGTPSTTTDQDDGAVAIATSLTTLLAAFICAIFL